MNSVNQQFVSTMGCFRFVWCLWY